VDAGVSSSLSCQRGYFLKAKHRHAADDQPKQDDKRNWSHECKFNSCCSMA